MLKIKCPECSSNEYTKAGKTIRERKKVQRYRCSKCLCVFSEPKLDVQIHRVKFKDNP